MIPAEEKRAVAAKLAAYTGTSADYWEKADLRVSHPQFLQELQRDQRLIAGRIDSRFVGPAVNPLAEKMDYDPFFPAIGPGLHGGVPRLPAQRAASSAATRSTGSRRST